jgi:hypothetical protein
MTYSELNEKLGGLIARVSGDGEADEAIATEMFRLSEAEVSSAFRDFCVDASLWARGVEASPCGNLTKEEMLGRLLDLPKIE